MSGILGSLGAVAGIVGTVGKVIDDLVYTDKERDANALERQREENKLLLGQQEINKAEAAHASLFVAGWRPYIGWVCGTALAMIYIPKALVMMLVWSFHVYVLLAQWNGTPPPPSMPPYPDLGAGDLIALLGALLGMSGLRTVETLKGKQRDALGPQPADEPTPAKPFAP